VPCRAGDGWHPVRRAPCERHHAEDFLRIERLGEDAIAAITKDFGPQQFVDAGVGDDDFGVGPDEIHPRLSGNGRLGNDHAGAVPSRENAGLVDAGSGEALPAGMVDDPSKSLAGFVIR